MKNQKVIEFLQQREDMIRNGFPICFTEKGVGLHCDSCMTYYKKKKELHKQYETRKPRTH